MLTRGKEVQLEKRQTDLDLLPGQESGHLKGIALELCNQRHVTPFTALLHRTPGTGDRVDRWALPNQGRLVGSCCVVGQMGAWKAISAVVEEAG